MPEGGVATMLSRWTEDGVRRDERNTTKLLCEKHRGRQYDYFPGRGRNNTYHGFGNGSGYDHPYPIEVYRSR